MAQRTEYVTYRSPRSQWAKPLAIPIGVSGSSRISFSDDEPHLGPAQY